MIKRAITIFFVFFFQLFQNNINVRIKPCFFHDLIGWPNRNAHWSSSWGNEYFGLDHTWLRFSHRTHSLPVDLFANFQIEPIYLQVFLTRYKLKKLLIMISTIINYLNMIRKEQFEIILVGTFSGRKSKHVKTEDYFV